MQHTYGEFIDLVKKTKGGEASAFMDEWAALATEEQWEEFRPLPLDKGMVLNLAQDMNGYFHERLNGIYTDALYVSTVRRGHEFLKEIHSAAVKLGIDVDLAEIDTPLSMADSLGAFQSTS